MDMSSFALFAQRMFDIGLVFNIEFTEEELGQLNQQPRWSLFDRKIMDGISNLPAGLNLPPRPTNIPISANSTLWSFIKCHMQAQRSHPGRRMFHFNPPTTPITSQMYTLEILIQELALANPISSPDNAAVPQKLIIIGVSF
jgi:hypothetical protein